MLLLGPPELYFFVRPSCGQLSKLARESKKALSWNTAHGHGEGAEHRSPGSVFIF